MVKTFQINGVEYAEYMSKTGYETEQVPVYASKITTLDGIDHYTKIRAKSVLKILTMPLTRSKAIALYDALSGMTDLTITYYNNQLGTVTQSMRIESIPLETAIYTTDMEIIGSVALTFTQN